MKQLIIALMAARGAEMLLIADVLETIRSLDKVDRTTYKIVEAFSERSGFCMSCSMKTVVTVIDESLRVGTLSADYTITDYGVGFLESVAPLRAIVGNPLNVNHVCAN